MTNIHTSACVSAKAELGDGVSVGPYSVIDADVVIGAGCEISSGVRIHSGVQLGTGVRVFHGAALGGEPQDLKFGGEPTQLLIGDQTVIREFVTVSRGTTSTGRTTIGRHCMLMAYAHVAHDCVLGDNVLLANSVNLAGHVQIEDFAIIGGMVPVHQFVRIGAHCMVGGGWRVPKDVPPYIIAAGQPLSYHGLNAIGLRRRGFSNEVRAAIKRAYFHLYQSDLNVRQAVEQITAEPPVSDEVQHILDFIAISKRGLIPRRRRAQRGDDEQ